jgi:arabinoxylan arabinofuranohydrolase
MKTKLIIAMMFITLIAGVSFIGCSSDGGGDTVTVTFNLGDYSEGTPPNPIKLDKGTSGGSKWPANPSRPACDFDVWVDKDNNPFYSSTLINEDVELTAQWIPEQPAKEALAELFDTAKGFPATLSDARKIWTKNNPSMTFAFVADPTPMVYCPNLRNSGETEGHSCEQCTLYVYGSNDTLAFNASNQPENTDFGVVIQGLRVVSTKDLVNWTDHGILNLVKKDSTNPLFDTPTEKIVPYANNTWAPSAEWKMVNGKPKFFLYFANGGNDTTVVVSDNGPVGPFYNPNLSESMINRGMDGFDLNGDPNPDNNWLFVPGTMIDDDGIAYMVLGGGGSTANPGNVRRAQIKNDMISIVGNGPALNLPWHFEAADIWKWQGRYYINYTTNWGSGKTGGLQNIDIAYVMNNGGPLEEFPTTSSRLLPNGNYGDNTNHASLFDFKNKTYLIYHASSATSAFGGPRLRTAHLVDITVNPNTGALTQAAMGADGVAQEGDFNPYNPVEAETMAIEGGVYTKGKGNETTASNGISVASIDTGDWLGLYGVNFDKKAGGATKFNAIVKLPVTTGEDLYVGAIEIRIDPEQQGITSPTNNSRLTTSAGQQSRITGGTVVGRVQVKAKSKADEGKWIKVSANLDQTTTGKHDLAFVFYSGKGTAFDNNTTEHYTSAPTPANDGRRIDRGFEIDQWWFE